MSDGAAQRRLARAWALLIACSALYFLADNEADNDLWMHLFSGRHILAAGAVPRFDDASYTAAGLPWIDHEWLTQVLFAWTFAHGGSTALWLLKLTVALFTAWLVWLPLARQARNWWARGPVMVLALATLSRGYAVRPQIVTMLGIAALLAWLERADARLRRRALFVVAAAFVIWSNAHGAVVVGLGILALYALDGLRPGLASGLSAPARVVLLGVAVVAVCATPYGADLFWYVARELQAPHPLSEWQPVSLVDPAQRTFLIMLAALIATLPFARLLRRERWWAVLVGGLAVVALRQQRHTPLFALCAAAPLADQCDAALDWAAKRTRFQFSDAAQSVLACAIGAFAVVQLALLGGRLVRDRAELVFDAADYPVGAVRYIAANGLRGNLALPLDWGGYALWHLAPNVAVSLDGRFATVYPPAVVEDGFAFFRGDGGSGAARLLDAYPTSLVLVPRYTQTPLDGRAEWRPLYADEISTLYGRDGVAAAAPSSAARGRLAFP